MRTVRRSADSPSVIVNVQTNFVPQKTQHHQLHSAGNPANEPSPHLYRGERVDQRPRNLNSSLYSKCNSTYVSFAILTVYMEKKIIGKMEDSEKSWKNHHYSLSLQTSKHPIYSACPLTKSQTSDHFFNNVPKTQ